MAEDSDKPLSSLAERRMHIRLSNAPGMAGTTPRTPEVQGQPQDAGHLQDVHTWPGEPAPGQQWGRQMSPVVPGNREVLPLREVDRRVGRSDREVGESGQDGNEQEAEQQGRLCALGAPTPCLWLPMSSFLQNRVAGVDGP